MVSETDSRKLRPVHLCRSDEVALDVVGGQSVHVVRVPRVHQQKARYTPKSQVHSNKRTHKSQIFNHRSSGNRLNHTLFNYRFSESVLVREDKIFFSGQTTKVPPHAPFFVVYSFNYRRNFFFLGSSGGLPPPPTFSGSTIKKQHLYFFVSSLLSCA